MVVAASEVELEVDQPLGQVTVDLMAKVCSRFAPPPKLTVSQFADMELIVTTGPMAGTHWNTDFAPYQRGIMDAFHEVGVEIVVVKGSSQWGKTACAVNIVAYHIAHDPCPILVVEPTIDPMAKDFSKNRLDPVIQASPALREVVSKRREKDGANTTNTKSYVGGSVSIGGANSAASLAARSIRVLVLDEVDRYPAELPGEGSTLAIAFKRTTAYRRRRRIFMASSPTIVDAPIDVWHKRGDQRRYYVPCPSCDHMQTYQWKNVKWDNADPATARIHCESCDYRIGDAERVAILSRGEWRAEADRSDSKVVSFHLWEAYSPFSSLQEIVKTFLQARATQKKGDKSEMHTFINTTLGEAIEPDEGDGAEPHVLLMRREQYEADIPQEAVVLTAGIDTQDDRLEIVVTGWGEGEECWFVDHQILPGDTSQPEVWSLLDDVLEHPYLHQSGHRLTIAGSCIDSAGHRTTQVYAYAARQAAKRLYAIIGRDGQRPIVSAPSKRKWGTQQRTVPLYTVGVDAAKALIISRLNLLDPGPGYVHLPLCDWTDEEFAEQLTSERLVTKFSKGVPSQIWKKIRPRNEILDCTVYSIAALRLIRPDYVLLKQHLQEDVIDKMKPKTPSPQRKWIPPRRKKWLH